MFHPTIHLSIRVASNRGFTLIELIVGMTVFAIGLAGILALLGTTFSSAKYSSHEVVVAGILREQMELVKNIRDTNLENYVSWDKILVEGIASASWTGGIYIIENNYGTPNVTYNSNGDIIASPVYLENITMGFPSDIPARWERTRLSLDAEGRYTHSTGTGTAYASYIIVSPLGHTGSTGFVPVVRDGKNQGWIIDARVIVKSGNTTREYDAKTMITDWVK